MRRATANVRFAEAVKVCEHYFGPPRQRGTSHVVFKPRGETTRGNAKTYQVRQVLNAIDRLEDE